MRKKTIKDFDISNKKILMRVDFNTPLNEDGSIKDDTRIKKALFSIKYLLEKNASIILMSHLGRPKGQKVEKLSLKNIAKRLSLLLNKKVIMAPDVLGNEVENMAKNLKPNQILLLENLRFYEAEENPEKDPSFAKQLASLADVYINEAFSVCHRNHSSICPITKFFLQKALAGFLLEKEIFYLSPLTTSAKKPFYVVLGGSKISTKIKIILKFLQKADKIFIGGGMAFCFLKAKGIDIANSIYEEDQLQNAKIALEKSKNIIKLPLDIKIADTFKNDADTKIISTSENITPNYMGLDIGPKTIEHWQKELQNANTIFFNGPLGVFEMKNFSLGTKKIIQAICDTKATKIAGGGDSIAAINEFNLQDKFTHISTGGGASLKYIEEGTLIGIEALSDKE